jgi:V-type H+-transporting ATPase subunit H
MTARIFTSYRQNREIGKLFKAMSGTESDPIDVVSALLAREDEVIVARGCQVLVQLFNAGLTASEATTTKLMDYLRVELQRDGKHQPLVYLSILALLQGVLRSHERRVAFVEAKGLDLLLGLVRDSKNEANTQLLYQSTACLWLLSYSNGVKDKMVKMEVVAVLVQLIKMSSKEKVVRMVLAIMVNLVDTGDMKNLLSVCGAMRMLEGMQQRAWSDEDMTADLETLTSKIGHNVEQSSTFDQYCKELMSGELEWSPMHKSNTFWEKNVHKFLDKDQQVLKLLVALIKPGERTSSKVLSVALHDIGEFVRFHPGGLPPALPPSLPPSRPPSGAPLPPSPCQDKRVWGLANLMSPTWFF